MSEDSPHPVPEAIRATWGGKIGLKRLAFSNPGTGRTAYASTIKKEKAWSGNPEIKIDVDDKTSYWNAKTGEHITGYEPIGNFIVALWSTS